MASAGSRWAWLRTAVYLGSVLIGIPAGHAFSRPQLAGPSVPIDQRVSFTHSHNDYEQSPPLSAALAARMDSVEVDVWLDAGELRVSHWGRDFVGTLRELYLLPLQARVEVQGSLSPTPPFLLWIELKQDDPALLARVHAELAHYSWISRYDGETVRRAAVDVVLTGSQREKLAYLRDYPVRYAQVDTHELPGSSRCQNPGCEWYALDYHDLFRWSGWGEMPVEEFRALQILVRRIHAEGRRLRIFNAPDERNYWDAALAAGVDLINTDRPAELRHFLELPVVPKGNFMERFFEGLRAQRVTDLESP